MSLSQLYSKIRQNNKKICTVSNQLRKTLSSWIWNYQIWDLITISHQKIYRQNRCRERRPQLYREILCRLSQWGIWKIYSIKVLMKAYCLIWAAKPEISHKPKLANFNISSQMNHKNQNWLSKVKPYLKNAYWKMTYFLCRLIHLRKKYPLSK